MSLVVILTHVTLIRSIGVALTKDAAIVATSRGFVRTFSQSGVQTGIFSVGSIVAVAGLHDLAIIIFHQGEPFEGNTKKCGSNVNEEVHIT